MLAYFKMQLGPVRTTATHLGDDLALVPRDLDRIAARITESGLRASGAMSRMASA